MAVDAPKVITMPIPGNCMDCAAICKGEVLCDMRSAPITPMATNETAAYNTMAVIMVIMTARGIVFFGSTTSSASVAMRA
jgi:hypothetical protein